jgi:hypothetical protein
VRVPARKLMPVRSVAGMNLIEPSHIDAAEAGPNNVQVPTRQRRLRSQVQLPINALSNVIRLIHHRQRAPKSNRGSCPPGCPILG